MITFKLETCKRISELLGEDGPKTYFSWIKGDTTPLGGEEQILLWDETQFSDYSTRYDHKIFPAYTLSDLSGLVWKKLGEKLGWQEKVCDWCGDGKFLQGFACYGGKGIAPKFHAGDNRAYQPVNQPPEWKYQAWETYEAFLTGGMEAADRYLAELIK